MEDIFLFIIKDFFLELDGRVFYFLYLFPEFIKPPVLPPSPLERVWVRVPYGARAGSGSPIGGGYCPQALVGFLCVLYSPVPICPTIVGSGSPGPGI